MLKLVPDEIGPSAESVSAGTPDSCHAAAGGARGADRRHPDQHQRRKRDPFRVAVTRRPSGHRRQRRSAASASPWPVAHLSRSPLGQRWANARELAVRQGFEPLNGNFSNAVMVRDFWSQRVEAQSGSSPPPSLIMVAHATESIEVPGQVNDLPARRSRWRPLAELGLRNTWAHQQHRHRSHQKARLHTYGHVTHLETWISVDGAQYTFRVRRNFLAIGVAPDCRRNGGADLQARATGRGATFLVPAQGFGPLRNPVHTVGFDFSGAVRLVS